MGLQEATQTNWGASEPHTYVRGAEQIDAIWFLLELDITTMMQLSFHKGVGDHRTVLVDVCTKLAIGKQKFHVVHPHARRLNSNNTKACTKYLAFLERQMQMHRMPERLHACTAQITSYLVSSTVQHQMQLLNNQTVEMQQGGEHQCHNYSLPRYPSANQSRCCTFRGKHTRH
jgi:hypothetical protein